MLRWFVECARVSSGCGSQYGLICEGLNFVRSEAMRVGWQDIGFNGMTLLCPSCQKDNAAHKPSVGCGILGGIGKNQPEKEMSVKQFCDKLSSVIRATVSLDDNTAAYYLRILASRLDGISKEK